MCLQHCTLLAALTSWREGSSRDSAFETGVGATSQTQTRPLDTGTEGLLFRVEVLSSPRLRPPGQV